MLNHNPFARAVGGERYEAMAPDTLDLAGRMDLATNALTNVWFSEEGWGLGFVVDFSRRPSALTFNHLTDAYLNIPSKFLEALVVCRLASGGSDQLDVDLEVLRSQLALLGDDGALYAPTDTFRQHTEAGGFSEVWGEGRHLLALSMLAQIDDDPRWVEIGKRKVDRMLSLTREKEGFRFLWKGRYLPGEAPPEDADEPSDPIEGGGLADGDPTFSMIYSVGALGHGSGLFYRVTSYEPALELCRGLAHWALARMFRHEDGHYDFFHFHHGLYALMAVCEYGIAADDREVLARVDACYRWAREFGDPLVGFYPELMSREYPSTEICEVADMVWLALCLTRAGVGDYWDDVDRWVRNMYAEGQMRDTTFFDDIPDDYFRADPPHYTYQDTDSIRERSVGSFWGWMRPHEGLRVDQTPDGPKLCSSSIMHCCTANGARTLYCVWDRIVTEDDGVVRVNLLLNRASPWLDVDSYLPVAGKVVLRIKDAPHVAVRTPEWCVPFEVSVTVGDQSRQPHVQGRYVHIRDLKPGDRLTLTFPVPERTLKRSIAGQTYTMRLRGSNVVDIEPKGIACPLYRDQPTGQESAVTRFVPEIRSIIW